MIQSPDSPQLIANWLVTPEIQAIMTALNREGVTARFVGGCVRNTLMCLPVTDIDIAIDVPPGRTRTLLEAAGIESIATGLQHGTWTAVINKKTFEITSLRQDVRTDGRHAEVAFVQDWAADARRRDFTINALYADAEGRLYDPLGGLPDLRARRVRFIGDPVQRIHEDYLRIMRFFRFHAIYGTGPMDPAGLAACARLKAGLDQIAKERITQELLKLCAAKEPVMALQHMDEAGVLRQCLPFIRPVQSLDTLIRLEDHLQLVPDALRRLAYLLEGAKPGEIATALRLSRKQSRELAARLSPQSLPIHPPDARRLGYQFGAEAAIDLMVNTAARANADLPPERLTQARTGAGYVFPVTASDLLDRGYSPGPELGQRLKAMQQDWIASDFTLDRTGLMARK